MKKALFLLLTLAMANLALAQHDGHALTKAKLGHDASHRIGKLVDQGKIDEVFIKNMKSIEIKAIPHTNHADPAFSVTAIAGASDAQVLLTFDMKGKYLGKPTVSGEVGAEEKPWEINSNELIEAALHWVMMSKDPEVAGFNNDLSKAALKQQKSENGAIQPVVELTSATAAKVLQVVLSAKGDFVSFSVLE